MRSQRKFERYTLSLGVHLKDKKGLHPVTTGNISKYGLFLGTNTPKGQRELIKIEIKFPHTEKKIEALVQVMWADTEGDSSRSDFAKGMGVKFFSMSDEDRHQWELFVEQVRTGRFSMEGKKAQSGETPPPLPPQSPSVPGAKDAPPPVPPTARVHTIDEAELDALGDLDNLEELNIDLGEGDDEGDENMPSAASSPTVDLSASMADFDEGDSDIAQALTDAIDDSMVPQSAPGADLKELPENGLLADLFDEPVEEEDDEDAMPPDLPSIPVEKETGEEERRVYARKQVSFRVRLGTVGKMRELLTQDISLGGLLLATSTNHDIGEPIHVVIVHPWTKNEYPIEAQIKRCIKDDQDHVKSVGIEFTSVDDDQRDSLLMFIESGYVLKKNDENIPIESEIILMIEETENQLKTNPIDSALHFKLALLYMGISDREKAQEHADIAAKLGHSVPQEILDQIK